MNLFMIIVKSLGRWLKNLFLLLLSLVFLLVIAIYILIGTPSGTQWLLETANTQLANPIKYSSVSGHLLADFNIKEVAYEDAAILLKVDDLALSWQPKQLLENRFILNNLLVDGVYFEQKVVAAEKDKGDATKEKFDLPEIVIPLELVLNEIAISNVQFISAPDAEPLIIDQLSLQGDVKASHVNISQLLLKSPDIDALLEGQVDLLEHYPLDIKSKLQLHKKDIPQLTLQGIIKGDLSDLNLKQSLSGDLNGEFDVTLYDVLAELAWQSSIDMKQIPFALLDKSMLENKQLFDLSVSAKGDLNAAEIEPLNVFLSKGNIELKGTVNWQPVLNWELALNAEHFDPAIISKDVYGDISLQLETQGTQLPVSNEGDQTDFKLNLALKKLQGSLLDQALSGEGLIALNKKLLTINQLKLASGDALVNVNGKLDLQEESTLEKPIDLTWDIAVPALEKLMPNMKGQIKGQGSLFGTQDKAKAKGKLDINQFIFEKNHINQAKVDFSLSMDELFANHLSLFVDKVQLDANEIKNIKLSLDGPLNAHHLIFSSNVMANQLSLELKGGYNNSDQSWQGSLDKLAAKGDIIGSWQQKESSPLFLSAKKAALDKLCLYDKKSNICVNGQWQDGKTQAVVNIGKLNLARIKEFLPKEIKQLTGEINADAKINLKEQLNAKVDLKLTPGIFSYQLDDDQTVRLKHKNGLLHAEYGSKKVIANLKLDLDTHSIDGNVEISTKALEADAQKAPLKGRVKLNVNDLAMVKMFVPEIEEIKGRIKGDVGLSGIVSKPIVIGKVELIVEKILVPIIGAEFKKIDIKLNADANKKVTLKGQIHSGKGKISLDGNLLMDADKSFPVSVLVKGDKFQVMDLPGMNAVISPDMKIKNSDKGLSILGQVTIPEAKIFLTDIPSGSKSVSDDTVIIGQEEKKAATNNMDLDVTVKLGDAVQVRAFGLKTNLTGKMRIKQQPRQIMTANGELRTVDGTFRALGQDLKIEKGVISYAGGYLDNPGINIKTSKEIRDEDIVVGVTAIGSAKELEISTYSSDPSLDSADINSLLLTGQKANSDEGARMYAGREITENLDVGVNMGGGDEGSEFVVRYKLRKNLQLEGTSSSEKSGGSLMYTIEFE